MKRLSIIMLFLGLFTTIRSAQPLVNKPALHIAPHQVQTLLRIINASIPKLKPGHRITQELLALKNARVKKITMAQALHILDELDLIFKHQPDIKDARNLQKKVVALRGHLLKLPVKPTQIQKPSTKPELLVTREGVTAKDSVINGKLQVKQNIIFSPKPAEGAFLNAVGSFSEGVRLLRDSIAFSQVESTKTINFVTPFHDIPIVVISIRFEDVTFATPVVSEVSSKGFTVKGLSLPPPETNVGFIDYIAIGV